jgi:hypothetical protein
MKRLVYMIALMWLSGNSLLGQCAMCRATVETHARTAENKAAGLNSAILFLLVIPYICAAIFWYVWKTNKKKTEIQNRKIKEGLLATEK